MVELLKDISRYSFTDTLKHDFLYTNAAKFVKPYVVNYLKD